MQCINNKQQQDIVYYSTLTRSSTQASCNQTTSLWCPRQNCCMDHERHCRSKPASCIRMPIFQTCTSYSRSASRNIHGTTSLLGVHYWLIFADDSMLINTALLIWTYNQTLNVFNNGKTIGRWLLTRTNVKF